MRAIETRAIEGTAALDIHRGLVRTASSDLGIVAVRGGKKAEHARGAHAVESKPFGERAAKAFRNVLDASEMYCSLKYEDFRGCPYGMFTRKGIAAFTTISVCVGTLSIVFGA